MWLRDHKNLSRFFVSKLPLYSRFLAKPLIRSLPFQTNQNRNNKHLKERHMQTSLMRALLFKLIKIKMTGTSTQTMGHAKRIESEKHENRAECVDMLALYVSHDKESWHRQYERKKKNNAMN